jgi:hypothetical protein
VVDRAQEHLGPQRAVRYLRKFHPWYVERARAPRALQDALQRAETLSEVRVWIATMRDPARCAGPARLALSGPLSS